MNLDAKISDAERDARIQGAAFYRLVERQGWGEGIYNHIAVRVPDDTDRFLIKPHEITYEEVTASSLVKVDCRADLDERSGVNKVGFNTHAPIMRARRDVACTIHLHTVPIMAVAAMRGGLRMLNIQSVFFYGNIAYQDFGGVTESVNAQQELLDALTDKKVLILRNHGAVITGRSVEDAFTAPLRLMAACELQMRLFAGPDDILEIDDAACKIAADQLSRNDSGRGGADWPAWLRRLDRENPGYRD